MVDYIKGLLLSMLVIISPIKEAAFGILFLIMADLVMGVIASKKIKDPFSYNKLLSTLIKMVVYNLLLLVCFVAETFLMEYVPWIKIGLAFLCSLEITSIGKKFETIYGISFIKFVREWINNQINKKTPN